jgi:hypothetical protein
LDRQAIRKMNMVNNELNSSVQKGNLLIPQVNLREVIV